MKSYLQKKRMGFTLIELLIVVVIIAILASLILPRLLGQPEKAIIAEGYQYLGVIRRAQESDAAPNQTGYLTIASGNPGSNQAGTPWSSLGLSNLPAPSRFIYGCAAGAFDTAPAAGALAGTGGTCTATRWTGAATANTITMGISNGFTYACGGTYIIRGAAGAQSGRCG